MSEATSGGVSPSVSVPSSVETPAPGSDGVQPASPPENSFKGTKHKVKIGGEETEVDYDDLVTDYQTRKAADKKFMDAARIMKEAGATKAEIEAFKKNPIQALKEAGVSKDQIRHFAEEYLMEHINYEQLSPAEKRAVEAEERAKKAEENLENRTKAEKEARRRDAEFQAAKEIDDEIGGALKAMGRKPTPRLIARVVESMIADTEAKYASLQKRYGDEVPDEAFAQLPKLKASDAVKNIEQEYMHDILDLLGSMPIAEARKFLPKSFLDGLRQSEVDEVRSQDPVGSRKARQTTDAPPKKDKFKRMTSNEFFKLKDQKWGT